MNKAALLAEIMQLSPEERRELTEELLACVEEDEAFVLTDEEKRELDRRYAEHQKDPSRAIPWEQVRARLWARYGPPPDC